MSVDDEHDSRNEAERDGQNAEGRDSRNADRRDSRGVDELGNRANEEKSKRTVITVMTISFAVAMLFLFSRGGTCERYERKMEQQKAMRNYIDSMRMEKDRKQIR